MMGWVQRLLGNGAAGKREKQREDGGVIVKVNNTRGEVAPSLPQFLTTPMISMHLCLLHCRLVHTL